MNITGINNFTQFINDVDTESSQIPSSNTSFADILGQAIQNLNYLQNKVVEDGNLLATGQVDNLHQIMITSEKAELALELTVQIRNKVIEAYQEIMRMQI